MTYQDILDEEEAPHHINRWDNRWSVCFYEVDRHYGGPEEGGWWYNSYKLVQLVSVEKTEAQALARVRRMNHLLRFLQHLDKNYRRDLYSMAYSGGYFTADYHVGIPPVFWKDRSHYE